MKYEKMILTAQEKKEREKRFREAVHLQELEGNPLDESDFAMFEMFDRECWPDEQRIAYIVNRAKEAARRQNPGHDHSHDDDHEPGH